MPKWTRSTPTLSYLTWRTAGITILLMCVTYMAFIGLGGFMNSIYPEDHGHDDHGYGGDDHEHHGSGSPIVFSLGVLLFLMGFPHVFQHPEQPAQR